MYIISQDSYFVMGMDRILKAINPHATHTLVAFDRGDGQILFFSMDSLLVILAEGDGFQSFICTRYLKVEKCAPVSLLKNEIRRVLKVLKDKSRKHDFRKIHLSKVEYQIFLRFLDFQSSERVAQSLNLGRKIVSNYKNAILRKLGLHSIAELLHIYHTWNDSFCCSGGQVLPDAFFLPRTDTNELRMIRPRDNHISGPAVSPPFFVVQWHADAVTA